jgi:hypothetical protein
MTYDDFDFANFSSQQLEDFYNDHPGALSDEMMFCYV